MTTSERTGTRIRLFTRRETKAVMSSKIKPHQINPLIMLNRLRKYPSKRKNSTCSKILLITKNKRLTSYQMS